MTEKNSQKTKAKVNVKNFLIFSGAFFVFVIFEFSFDFVEVLFGNYLSYTNEGREKLGRIYKLEEKNLSALSGIDSIFQGIEEEKQEAENLANIDELKKMLNRKGDIALSKEKFLAIYSSIPSNLAIKMIEPFELLEFAGDANWVKVFIQKQSSVKIYFVDKYNRVLRGFPVTLEDFNLIRDFQNQTMTELKDLEEFQEKIVDGQAFLNALNTLPIGYRQQIINNPFKLVEWRENIKFAGISGKEQNGSKEIAFEVHTGTKVQIYKFIANSKALDFLIKNLEVNQE
ncbi:hypothetical protein IT568_03005 [bacterium]|nr:hypothetical protein [bacterium]